MSFFEGEIRRVHERLDRHGYAVTTDEGIGFSAVARKHIATIYFTDEVLSVESDPDTFPVPLGKSSLLVKRRVCTR